MTKLEDMVQYACCNVPFYKGLCEDFNGCPTFSDLPIITKQMIRESYDNFFSEEYEHYPHSGFIVHQRTSGSTGLYLKIKWDKNDIVHSLWELWLLRHRYYGISPSDKYCTFYTTDYRNGSIIEEEEMYLSEDGRSINFSKNTLTMEKVKTIYQKLLDFEPKWMMTQPSMALLLVQCIEKNQLPKLESLKYIELAGEMLLPEQKKLISRTFNCQVTNQYGCNETNTIALECPCGNLHLISSNIFAEVIQDGNIVDDGQEGQILLSCLTNHAMPFLRYEVGDCGKLESGKKCACGNPNKILTLTRGRHNDVISTENGELIDAFVLIRPIEMINEKVGDMIQQFQIVQIKYKHFVVKLSVSPRYHGWQDTISKLFLNYLSHPYFKDCHFQFDFHEALFPESNGKLAFFVRDPSIKQ